jgi:hypothetical protein
MKKAAPVKAKPASIAKSKAKSVPAYKNSKLAPAARVKDLLKRMTVQEKAEQMRCVWLEKAQKLVDEKGNFDLAKAKAAFKGGRGIGQVGRPSDAGGGKNARDMAVLTNEIQKFFLENTRLGIPVVFHEECLHGHAAPAGTSFSQPIGLGATFNPELVERLFTMTAEEARSAARIRRSPRWWTWRASRAGGASKRPTAKIPSWFRVSVLLQCAASRATRSSATRSTSSPR